MAARILVVEDNRENLELMTYLLEAFGYTALRATDGVEGLDAIRRENPDLVLCDLQMPRLDGYEVIRQVRSDSRLSKLPVVAVTAYAMLGDRDRVLAAGFDGYISKPIVPEEFVGRVEPFLPAGHQAAEAPAAASGQPRDAETRQPVEPTATLAEIEGYLARRKVG